MNKQLTNKAVTIFKQQAKKFGIEDPMICSNPSPSTPGNLAVYIDGDLYDEYNMQGFTGYKFHDAVDKACEAQGIFIEPYTASIIDVYKA